MTFARRLTLIILGVLLIILVTGMLLLPDLLTSLATVLGVIPPAIRIALVVVFDIIIMMLLYLRLRAAPRPNRSGLIVRASGALADVSVESATERILRAVRSVPNVESAEATVQALNGRADIDMEVNVVGENVNVPKKQQEIDRTLRQVTLKQLGLQFASRPRIHIQLASELPPIVRPDLTPPPSRSFVERVEPPAPVVREAPIIATPPAPRFEREVVPPPVRDESVIAREEPVIVPPPAPSTEPEFLPSSEPLIEDFVADEEPEIPAASSDSESVGLLDEDGERREEDRPKPPDDTAL